MPKGVTLQDITPKKHTDNKALIPLTRQLNLALLNSIYPYNDLIHNIKKLEESAQSEGVKHACQRTILEEFGKVRGYELKDTSVDPSNLQGMDDEEIDRLLKDAETDLEI